MEQSLIQRCTGKCYSGEPSSCTYACPFRLDLRSFLKKCKKGRWLAAYKELRSAVYFPTITAKLCPHPCESFCQCNTVIGGDAIAIQALESACIRHSGSPDQTKYAVIPKPQRMVILGAGLAGLTCALALAQKGFEVQVIDAQDGWGGSLREHPSFLEFRQDFTSQFTASPVQFTFGKRITTLAELPPYDALFIATGQNGTDFSLLEQWNSAYGDTIIPGVFLGGELAGFSLIEGAAHAVQISNVMESWVQTQDLSHNTDHWDSSLRTRYVPHEGHTATQRILPSQPDGYTQAEAKEEAARCHECDCTLCMDHCSLLKQYKKRPPRIGTDVYMDGQSRNSISSASITRQTWSCNLCGNCSNICPENTDLRSLFQASRADRVEHGYYPPALHHYWMKEFQLMTTQGRLVIQGTQDSHYAFFPGCRLGGVNQEYVLRTFTHLRTQYGAGLLLNCCGIPAWWAGEDSAYQSHIQQLQADWESLGKPTLVVACATCIRTLNDSLPQIKCVPLYAMLPNENVQSPFPDVAIFHPCAAQNIPAFKDSVVTLAQQSHCNITPYDSDGQCCGFGGHMQLANPTRYDNITHQVAHDCDVPYLVSCVNCLSAFQHAGKSCVHILDMVFDLPIGQPVLLSQRRKHALELKSKLQTQYGGEGESPVIHPWDTMQIIITPDVQKKMERQLICEDDVRETIWNAEQQGTGFSNADGMVLCSFDGGPLMYWVSYYPKENQTFDIIDVYTHRMHVRKEDV